MSDAGEKQIVVLTMQDFERMARRICEAEQASYHRHFPDRPVLTWDKTAASCQERYRDIARAIFAWLASPKCKFCLAWREPDWTGYHAAQPEQRLNTLAAAWEFNRVHGDTLNAQLIEGRMLEVTSHLKRHPDGWDFPCECQECGIDP